MNISLRSKVVQKLLNFFFIHKDERFYISELSKWIKEEKSNINKQLSKLLLEGILSDEFKGNQHYFFINKDYRFLDEYETIIKKTFGIEAILKDKLSAIKGIDKAIIFGSYASNKMKIDSDLDLLIVGTYDIKKVSLVLATLQKEWRLEINTVEYSLVEYNKKLKTKDNFLINVFKNPIINII